MNWLDILLVVILAASVVGGLAKGFARTGLGFAAAIVGLFCGLWFYGLAGAYVRGLAGSQEVANLIGFFLIFGGVVLLGALLGYLLEKLFKLVHLSWLDRLLGGVFGVLRGALIAAAIVLAMLAFAPKSPPRSVAHSHLAPYVIDAAGAMAAAAPHEIREGFSRGCERVKKLWSDALKKGVRHLPEQEI